MEIRVIVQLSLTPYIIDYVKINASIELHKHLLTQLGNTSAWLVFLSMSSMDHSLACTRKDDAYPMEGVMDRHLLKHKN